jgi:hypothetical protein
MLDPNDRAGYLAIPVTRELYPHRESDQAIVEKIAFYRSLLMAESRPFNPAENPTKLTLVARSAPVIAEEPEITWESEVEPWAVVIPPPQASDFAQRLNRRRAALNA